MFVWEQTKVHCFAVQSTVSNHTAKVPSYNRGACASVCGPLCPSPLSVTDLKYKLKHLGVKGQANAQFMSYLEGRSNVIELRHVHNSIAEETRSKQSILQSTGAYIKVLY